MGHHMGVVEEEDRLVVEDRLVEGGKDPAYPNRVVTHNSGETSTDL